MSTRKFPLGNELEPDAMEPDLKDDLGQFGPDSAGQSGDSQGLSGAADASDESVEELADSGQSFEAEAVAGVEDAADHPEQPVRSHEDFRRPNSIPPTD